MAHLPENDDSSVGDYSESFELDDSDSRELSSDMSRGQADMQEPLVENVPKHPALKKPPRPERVHSSGMDLSRTVRSPIAMSQHLHLSDSHLTCIADGPTKENEQPVLKSTPGPTLKQVASKVQKMQLSAKKFKSSGEIREVAFKEWLAKKEVKDMRARRSLEQSKQIDSEKKKSHEVFILFIEDL